MINKIHQLVEPISKGAIDELDGHKAIFEHADWVVPRWEASSKIRFKFGWTFFDNEHFYESGEYYLENRLKINSSLKVSSDQFMWLIKRLEGTWIKL